MTVITLDVVVAYHSDRTYVQLLDELHAALEGRNIIVRAVVYDKSGCSGISEAPRCAHERQIVPNVGRESETYIRHIADRHGGLADYTLFVQDDASVHVPHHHRGGFFARIEHLMADRADGEVLQVVYRGRKLAPPRRIDQLEPLYGRLRAAADRFGVHMPETYETNVCAFVLASRECLTRRPRSFYEELLRWHGESASAPDRKRRTEEEHVPWVMEHLWQLILFGPQPPVAMTPAARKPPSSTLRQAPLAHGFEDVTEDEQPGPSQEQPAKQMDDGIDEPLRGSSGGRAAAVGNTASGSSEVTLGGLKARPELNGTAATIIGPIDRASGRYPVRLANGEKILVKPDNFANGDPTSSSAADAYVGGRNERGERHGHGKWTHADGREYDGEWRDGRRHGLGTMRYADGASYEGGFRDGLREGRGEWCAANGDKYSGEWRGGLMHGAGQLVRTDDPSKSRLQGGSSADLPLQPLQPLQGGSSADGGCGSVYEGTFVGGKMHGEGTISYRSRPPASYTLQYTGQWEDGRWHGRGKWTGSKGASYDGEWRQHRRHGYGISVGADGQVWFRGYWRHNTPVFGNPYWFAKRGLAWLLRRSSLARFVHELALLIVGLLTLGSAVVLTLAIAFAPAPTV